MSREFWLGLFTTGTLAILASGVFLIGRRQSLFSSTYPLKAEFDNVGGLNPGAAVRVGGTYQGTVKQINLPRNTSEKVVVVMNLEKDTRSLIRTDSVATIKAEGLLGDKFMEVSIGSESERPVHDNEMIQSAPPIDISDLVTKSNRILDTATNVVDNVEQITTNLSSVSAKIDQGQGTMGALINDKTLYRQAAAGTTSFSDNMQALKRNFFLRGFFKSRGYENADELRKHAVRELPKTTQLHRFAYDASKLFDKADNAKLKNEKELNAGGKFLQTEKFGLAVVVASAGMKGDSEDALVLTQARAMVVRDYLVNHFAFNDTRLKTLGLGKSQDTGDTGKVELLVYPEAPK